MTRIRDVGPEESEDLWIDGTVRGITPDGDPVAMYERYLDEGHLVVLTSWEDHPTDATWFVHCSCMDEPDVFPLNFGQVVLWHRDHRAERGLESQELAPVRTRGGSSRPKGGGFS